MFRSVGAGDGGSGTGRSVGECFAESLRARA